MNERIKQLREALGLTQKDFGERLGISGSGVSAIEAGSRSVTDKHILLLESSLHINPDWLRTGEGEMFVKSDSSLVAQLAKEYGLDGAAQTLLSTFLGLESGSRDVIIRFMKDFANRLSAGGAPGSSADETGALYFNQWTEPHKQRAKDDNGLDFRENNI